MWTPCPVLRESCCSSSLLPDRQASPCLQKCLSLPITPLIYSHKGDPLQCEVLEARW